MTKLPPLTADDLSDRGWEIRRAELEARGIDPGKYLRRELPKAIKRDPELRLANDRLQADRSAEQRLRHEFFKWGYRATLIGIFGLLVVGVLRLIGTYNHERVLFITVSAIVITVIIVVTTYSLFIGVRYVRVWRASSRRP